MSLLSNLFSRPYGCFKSDDNEISLDSLVLLTIDDLKKAIRDEVQASLENKVSESLVRALTVSKIKDELKEHAVNEALKLSEKYSDTLPKRRSSKQTLLLSKDFLKVMLQENHSAIELLKELFADENTFELYYLPVIEDTASHTYRFVLKNMKEDAFSYFLKLTTMMMELAKESTYLYDDFASSKANLAIVLYSSSFVISKLLYEHNFVYGKEKQSISLVNTSLADLFNQDLSLKEISVIATPCECSIRPEQLVSLGLLILKDKVCNIVTYLKEHNCDKLLVDLVKPELTSRLYTLLLRARELIANGESYKDCEFLEAVRPVFVGVPHTPENWFSDPIFNGENYFYPDEVLQKVKLHKSICCYVNHSKKAVETFLSSYKVLQEKKALEKAQAQAFKNERTLLSAASTIDFKKRKSGSHEYDFHENSDQHTAIEDERAVTGGSSVAENKIPAVISSAPTLEELMLGGAPDNNAVGANSASLSPENKVCSGIDAKVPSYDNLNLSSSSPVSLDDTALGDIRLSANGNDSLMANLMRTEAIVNRFCYKESLADVTDPQVSDTNTTKAYKLIVSKLKDHTLSSNVIKRALDSRVSRIKPVIDVVNGFIKDGAFAIDFDLDAAIKSATTYVDYSRALLATRYSAMHNYKRNKVGVDYLNHFIEKEVVFLSKVLKEQA
ncbi:unknown [Succinatimonas sp. CAG:777]|nr:unknown [Succinatimonas sp. CAG:777]